MRECVSVKMHTFILYIYVCGGELVNPYLCTCLFWGRFTSNLLINWPKTRVNYAKIRMEIIFISILFNFVGKYKSFSVNSR